MFTPEAQQDAVFEAIALPAISNALEGINGTGTSGCQSRAGLAGAGDLGRLACGARMLLA